MMPNSAGWEFTEHSIARYRERTGCKKSDETIKRRLSDKLQGRKHIGGDHWYYHGWVFVIVGNIVVTVMRPKEHYMHEKVFNACNR